MKKIFLHRFSKNLEEGVYEVLLVFCPHIDINPTSVADILDHEIRENLAPDEILFAVPQPAFVGTLSAFEADPMLMPYFRKLESRTKVRLVSYRCDGSTSDEKTIIGGYASEKVSLCEITQPAITSIFRARGGFVQATGTYHFVNPSGRHTERFLRLSNILVDSAEINFLGFCCLSFISSQMRFAYIDTPALYAILSSVNEFRSMFGLARLEVGNFRSYEGFEQIDDVDEIHSLVMISASSSGGLASRLQKDVGFPADNLIHFLFLGESDSVFPVVCDLAYDSARNPDGISEMPGVYESGACLMCRQGSFPVHLHGDQFDIRGPQPDPLIIRKSDAPASLSETMRRLAGTGALSVRPGTPDTRHREYYVNTDGLFLTGPSQKRMEYILRRSVPASVTNIIQVDEWSSELADIVKEHVLSSGGSAEVIQANEVDKIASCAAPSVVVVGAAIESGRCLTDISRDLRSVGSDFPILYIVGFEKTTGMARREALKKTIVQCSHPLLHEFVAIERMVLPDSAGRNAWNDELELFQDPNFDCLLDDDTKIFVRNRVKRLNESSKPLVDELFLPTIRNTALSLQPGFVFWPDKLPTQKHTQADVYFTIMSVLQQLRANAQSSKNASAIRAVWYHQTILDPTNFARFNDDIIQASLLRASSPSELNYEESPDESRELCRIVSKIVESAGLSRGGSAPEFLLALATKRLCLRADDLQCIVDLALKSAGIVKGFGKMLEKQLQG